MMWVKMEIAPFHRHYISLGRVWAAICFFFFFFFCIFFFNRTERSAAEETFVVIMTMITGEQLDPRRHLEIKFM